MTLFKSMSVMSAALLCATALFVSSCEDTTTLPTTFIPATPTGLKALSVNDSTIRIQFSASASEGAVGFKEYKLSAVSGSSTVNFTIPKGYGSPAYVDLTGLAAGKTWTLSLKAVSNDSASEAVSINWATATRYTGLKAYSRTSILGSGINLSLGTQLTVDAGGQWDLCFDSDSLAFGSPSVSSYVKSGTIGGSTPRRTYIFGVDANTFYTPTADSLNQLYDNKAINDTSTSRKLKIEGTFDVESSKHGLRWPWHQGYKDLVGKT